jgi:Family of unknown function (DUF5317)
MALWALALIVGALGGLATGGSIAGLAATRFRAWPLLAMAVLGEACLGAIPSWSRAAVAVAACVAVAGWCAANRLPAWPNASGHALLGLGVALNATVMALNSGMPVSPSALAAAGLPRTMDVAKGDLYKHLAMTSHTRLAVLGDTVPFRFLRTVMSPGDLLMLAGIAAIVWCATKQPSTRAVRLAELASRTPPRPAH